MEWRSDGLVAFPESTSDEKLKMKFGVQGRVIGSLGFVCLPFGVLGFGVLGFCFFFFANFW